MEGAGVGSNAAAVGECSTCGLLCHECLRMHCRVKVFLQHRVVPLQVVPVCVCGVSVVCLWCGVRRREAGAGAGAGAEGALYKTK